MSYERFYDAFPPPRQKESRPYKGALSRLKDKALSVAVELSTDGLAVAATLVYVKGAVIDNPGRLPFLP